MTERHINGDAVRSKYRKARKVADSLGLSDDVLDVIAEGVREFDAGQSTDVRAAKALEKIAASVAPPAKGDYEEQRLRRREVYALELTAVSMLADQESVNKILASARFRALVDRLSGGLGASE